MSRRIVTSKLDAVAGGANLDGYFDKVVKYIPADVIAAWTAVTGLISSATGVSSATLLWIAFVVGIVVTAAWTIRQTTIPKLPLAITQTAISTGAFIIWVAALGGPFNSLGFWNPAYGSLLLIAYTLLVALINPPEGKV
jgi:hypothetical protein